jgi:ATP-dependent DNA helicase RecQ
VTINPAAATARPLHTGGPWLLITSEAHTQGKTSAEGIDERLLVRLRLLVAEALVGAESWVQLQDALAKRGLRFVPSGGGLLLTDLASGRPLAKSSQVGPAYMALVRRFSSGFPGHPSPGIAAQALRPPAPPSAVRGSAGAQAR